MIFKISLAIALFNIILTLAILLRIVREGREEKEKTFYERHARLPVKGDLYDN